MDFLRALLNRKEPDSISLMPVRFRQVFEANGLDVTVVPRLIPQLKFSDLLADDKLLKEITPEVIDATAQLFGVRSEWLQGLDDFPYQVAWSRGTPQNLLARLSDAIAPRGKERNHFPLRVLTTSMNLDRQGNHQQWLLPVIVETVDELGDTPIHRCHIFGNHYDWTNEAARLEIKALAWVVYHQLGSPVSLYQVTPKEMEKFMMGEAIPSVLWRKGLLSAPSLEDFALSKQESVQAKETDELAKLQEYLDVFGLKEWRFEASLPSQTDSPEPAKLEEAKNATPATPEKPAPGTRMASGKRQTQQANWDAILASADTIWADQRQTKQPRSTYADMIQRLKAMPHLKASGLSDSAIHKKLRAIAPPEVRGKPGRKPKQSA